MEELEVYQITLDISNLAWQIYNELPGEHRFTQGSQFLEAADSIGANIAEGFGRYHYGDSLEFYFNSRGWLFELKPWTTILTCRSLLSPDKLNKMKELNDKEHLKLNSFINSNKTRNLL